MKHIKSFNLEKWIHNQVQVWEFAKSVQEKEEEPMPFITISREYGCVAGGVVTAIAEALNKYEETDVWFGYDKELLHKIVDDYEVNEKLLETIDTKVRAEMNELMMNMLTDYPPQVSAYKKLIRTVRTLAMQGRKIILGRAGVVITRDMKYGLHVRLIASQTYRLHKIMEEHNIKDRLEAEKLVKKKDKERHEFLTQYIKFDASNPSSYHLTINVEKFSKEEIAEIVISALKAKKFIK
ncbi:MAG: cytidylate kinase-like family protein [bacterium]|nr:cytidylate kinase-like family protein [bacterium]